MTLGRPAPSAELQLAFLGKLQRLFAEGDFTSTYKFALLVSLGDLAVEIGADDGEPLGLGIRQIGERFVSLYWQQATPYGTGRIGSSPGVLVQNVGVQARVLTLISEFRASAAASTVHQARQDPRYSKLLGDVAEVVATMPLRYLQNFGGQTDEFLFRRTHGGIELLPGVAYCLRRFYPLVQQLSRFHWIEHLKSNKRNHAILGEAGDLEDFLFATSRQSLALIGHSLRKLDGSRCFYCDGSFPSEPEVDHFIPFSLYPRDLAHNFVMAHAVCNRSKSDTLAGRVHLEKWVDRLTLHSDALMQIGHDVGITASVQTARRVATWSYKNAYASGARAWVRSSQYEAIDDGHIAALEPVI